MAEVRLEEWESVVETVEALWADGSAVAERYAGRLTGKLPEGHMP